MEGPPGPPGVSPAHGLEEFTDDRQFAPPDGVTTVFVQAWGAGGGGSGSDVNTGSGGGGGGFAWCLLPVQPGTPVTVDIGTPGAGGPDGANGQPGTSSTVDNGLGGVVFADGGNPGTGLIGGQGGYGKCPGQGTVRQGPVGGAGGAGGPGLGGRPAVNGVIPPPALSAAGIGGNGAPHPPPNERNGLPGGPGYVVIWW
ncbi:hypothetical protein [Streptomyces sp. NPDC026673]|uniref:glycine-rich domain-containing protein n=1 Tax=Streptomyces sp. NPDC026673 TaxID=3155724 RepID=UPI0033D94CA8